MDANKERAKARSGSSVGYNLRNIPADLWRRVRMKAAESNMNVRDTVIEALKRYIKG